jgi:hypothetical protein
MGETDAGTARRATVGTGARRSTGGDTDRPSGRSVGDRGSGALRPGVADVLLIAIAIVSIPKGIDAGGSAFGGWFAVAWVAACVVAPWWRAGWGALAVLAFGGWLVGGLIGSRGVMQSSHVVLIAWVALTLALAREPRLRDLLLRITAATVYLFATLQKINPGYLAGDTLRFETGPLPPSLLAIGGVVVEGWLAYAVWRRTPWALPVAILLHGMIVATMWTGIGGLVGFNALMVLLVWQVCYREGSGNR